MVVLWSSLTLFTAGKQPTLYVVVCYILQCSRGVITGVHTHGPTRQQCYIRLLVQDFQDLKAKKRTSTQSTSAHVTEGQGRKP